LSIRLRLNTAHRTGKLDLTSYLPGLEALRNGIDMRALIAVRILLPKTAVPTFPQAGHRKLDRPTISCRHALSMAR
jgi:hypothetical protein